MRIWSTAFAVGLVLLGTSVCRAAPTTATISLSTSTVAWGVVGYADVAFPASNTIVITGTMKTRPGGAGDIVITAPTSLSGANGAPFDVTKIHVTCTGAAKAGQTYDASDTPLSAGGSVTCASYGSKFNSAVNITVKFTLDDRTLDADTYTGGNVFSMIATAP